MKGERTVLSNSHQGKSDMNGGHLVGEVLKQHGVQAIFTLCGGHISPILAAAEQREIKVVDVRDEKNAVFAADALARMTGIPGIAALTAGPGLTNTITAVKNAQMAQSPVIVLGGATATILKGRGSLQDIDQMSLMAPHVKWATSCQSVKEIIPNLERAFRISQSGVPGPVFIELPVDLLYDETTIREWYMRETGVDKAKNLGSKALKLYLNHHLGKLFSENENQSVNSPIEPRIPALNFQDLNQAVTWLSKAERPVVVLGSQTLTQAGKAHLVAKALSAMGIPTYLGGMGRGLLGTSSDIQFRHRRTKALKEADVVLVVGFPFDFRLGYGRSISSKATLISANRCARDLTKNRKPDLAIHADAGDFLIELGHRMPKNYGKWESWIDTLRCNEREREEEITNQAKYTPAEYVNPLQICQEIEKELDDKSVLIVDGGDFVATASYILRPRSPLSWLDPGVFGTLGVGGGFATGAAVARPDSERWIIYGDGSAAYSLAEFDTFVRHQMPVIAVVGTDASWAQIAREQVEMLGTAVGTTLLRTDYHIVAEGYGGKGVLITQPSEIQPGLKQAKAWYKEGFPVLVNVHIASTDFRKGSISM